MLVGEVPADLGPAWCAVVCKVQSAVTGHRLFLLHFDGDCFWNEALQEKG